MNIIIILITAITLILLIDLVQDFCKKRDYKKKELERKQMKRWQDEYIHFLNNWIKKRGMKLEKQKGYPKDWKIRRQAVFVRDNFTCQVCHEEFPVSFIPSDDYVKEFFDYKGRPIHEPEAGYICSGVHVHHIKKVKDGGYHNLENLKLLCKDCHINQKGHQALHRRVKVDEYRRIRMHKNKLRTAKINHVCDICDEKIFPGEKYYWGYYYEDGSSYSKYYHYRDIIQSKICFRCFKKYISRRKFSS